MLDTSMNAILFAKKLRNRQAELKAKYKKISTSMRVTSNPGKRPSPDSLSMMLIKTSQRFYGQSSIQIGITTIPTGRMLFLQIAPNLP